MKEELEALVGTTIRVEFYLGYLEGVLERLDLPDFYAVTLRANSTDEQPVAQVSFEPSEVTPIAGHNDLLNFRVTPEQ